MGKCEKVEVAPQGPELAWGDEDISEMRDRRKVQATQSKWDVESLVHP